MRLTYELGHKGSGEYDTDNTKDMPINNIWKAINKLGKLEDVEEQYDIDLIIFSKLLDALDKDCVYVKVKKIKQYDGYSAVEETGEIESKNIARFSRYINGTRDWYFTTSFGDISGVNNYLLKDYIKTWALTREELEE